MTTIWHNPRCSKSRQTLALLQENGIEPAQRLYLKNPPTEAEITVLQAELGVSLIDMMRPKDALFKDLGLSTDSDETALKDALLAHPALLERPIVTHKGKAAIGRPPEQVLALF